jgi:hypothetical protein
VISIEAGIRAVVFLIIAGVIFGLLYWLIQRIKILQPFKDVAEAILLIAAVVVVIGVLLNFVGVQVFRP